jgi:hypothetical protein
MARRPSTTRSWLKRFLCVDLIECLIIGGFVVLFLFATVLKP